MPRLAAELNAQATAIGSTLPGRESLVRMIYEWEAGTHRPRAYYVLFVLVYATEEELAARTIQRGSELGGLMPGIGTVVLGGGAMSVSGERTIGSLQVLSGVRT